MHRLTIPSLLLAAAVGPGCSSTPGDAAARSGQPEAAAKLYERGASQGDAVAALKLGLLVSEGRATGYGTAGSWFLKSCQLGEVVGCHNVGVGYEYAQYGLQMNYAEAARFYRMAAERGYMQSQYNLGSMYSNRYLSDDVEGLKWLLLSQKVADSCLSQPLCKWVRDDPPGHVSKLMGRMSTADVQSAKAQAAAWSPRRES